MTLRNLRFGWLLIVSAGLALMAATTVYAQAATTVQMMEFSFTPAQLSVAGGTSRWTLQNTGQFPHNVHIEGNGVSMDVKSDGPVAGGESFSGTVNLQPGRYDIWCPVGNHRERGMVGVLTVAGAGAGAAAQVPGALPRTGDADTTLPFMATGLIIGIALIGAGLMLRRRDSAM